jgi:hypothetical protein
MWFPALVPYYFLCLAFVRFKMTKNEALERKAENARELGLDYEPWEKFCDSNCVWTNHHPDCKLAQRTWVGLTNEDLANCSTDEAQWALYWEKLLKEKNT